MADKQVTYFAVSWAVTVITIILLRKAAPRLGLVDSPGARKKHFGNVPAIGGISILTGMLLSLVSVQGWHRLPLEVVVVVAVCGLGALDDRFDLPAALRLCVQFGAATVLVFSDASHACGQPLYFRLSGFGPFTIPLLIVSVVALMNAVNMIDGLDGLAAGVVLVASTAFLWLLLPDGPAELIDVALAMIGATLAFLIFNVPADFNRRVLTFLGDGGSNLMGFLLAALSLHLMLRSGEPRVAPTTIIFFLPIPIFELLSSVFRRVLSGRSPFEADGSHFHHQLRDSGMRGAAIMLVYVAFSCMSSAIGMLLQTENAPAASAFAGFVALFGAWSALPIIRRRVVRWGRATTTAALRPRHADCGGATTRVG